MDHLEARIYAQKLVSTGLSTSTKVAIGVGVSVLGLAGAVVAAPFVLAGAGFTAGGVAAGSLAAGWQATIGNVVAGSIFASLQSAGAAGLGAAGIGVASAAGAAAGGAVGGIIASGAKKSIPVVKLEKTFDIYDSDQDGYVSGRILENILRDLEIQLSESELRDKFKKSTGCSFNHSTPVSYEEFLALFEVRLYKGKELKEILENLFTKFIKEKGMLSLDDVREMLPALNVNASEKHVEACFEKILNGGSDKPLTLENFLKLFGVSNV